MSTIEPSEKTLTDEEKFKILEGLIGQLLFADNSDVTPEDLVNFDKIFKDNFCDLLA